ncbi:MAG: VOC family protein [Acidimicrobiales bacterium]
MKVERFDHAAIAVRDLRAAVGLFCGVLGAEMIHGGDDERLGMRTVQLQFPGGSKIELLQPLAPDTRLARFLDTRGEGLHHITFFVDDVADAERALNEAGFETVDTDLRDPDWRETYLRPRSGFGTLIQLADTARDGWTEPTDAYTVGDVIEGRILWDGADTVWRDGGSRT